MKISIAADCHLNKSTYKNVKDLSLNHLPFRTVDFMKAFEFVVNQTLEFKPDLFVLIGDAFDDSNPSIDVISFFNEQMSRLMRSGITCYILVGNHDFGKRNHALQPLQSLGLDKITIIDKPCIVREKDGYNLAFFPHSLEVELGEKGMRQSYLEFIQTLNGFDSEKTIAFGHFGVQGAIMNQWMDKPDGMITEFLVKRTRKNAIRNSDSDAITIKDLEETNAKYIYLGDYHKHQTFDIPNKFAMYVGSIEKTDINEMGQKKGFFLFDDSFETNKKIGKSKYVEYVKSRPFLELRGNWNEIRESAKQINSRVDEYIGAITKIIFTGKESELIDFNANVDKLKRWIVEKIKPAHLIVEIDAISEDISTQEKTEVDHLLENGNLVISDLEPVIFEIIEDLSMSTEYKASLKEIAKEVLQESK